MFRLRTVTVSITPPIVVQSFKERNDSKTICEFGLGLCSPLALVLRQFGCIQVTNLFIRNLEAPWGECDTTPSPSAIEFLQACDRVWTEKATLPLVSPSRRITLDIIVFEGGQRA